MLAGPEVVCIMIYPSNSWNLIDCSHEFYNRNEQETVQEQLAAREFNDTALFTFLVPFQGWINLSTWVSTLCSLKISHCAKITAFLLYLKCVTKVDLHKYSTLQYLVHTRPLLIVPNSHLCWHLVQTWKLLPLLSNSLTWQIFILVAMETTTQLTMLSTEEGMLSTEEGILCGGESFEVGSCFLDLTQYHHCSKAFLFFPKNERWGLKRFYCIHFCIGLYFRGGSVGIITLATYCHKFQSYSRFGC